MCLLGRRTAWSSTVSIGALTVRALFWYDGEYIYNAKEDAALEALQMIRGFKLA